MTSVPEQLAQETPFYALDNVHLTSVGIDVGSSTMHLSLSAVHLQRDAQNLSSRFRVVETRQLHRSAIVFTPYRPGGLIDVESVGEFLREEYAAAGVGAPDVDTGAVILTGEALKQHNARPLAETIASNAGDFVCVSAGHHLEAALSAYGSGAVALSRNRSRILCVDIGGGTTKLSLLHCGEIICTSAIDVGARILSWDDEENLVHLRDSSRLLLPEPTAQLEVGKLVPIELREALTDAVFGQIRSVLERHGTEVAPELLLTGPTDDRLSGFDSVVFTGGVSEYVYERESHDYHDIGQALGRRLRTYLDDSRLAVREPEEGIRATVVGAAEQSLQVSGSTVAIAGDVALPLRNVGVCVPPVVEDRIDADEAMRALLDTDPGGANAAAGIALRFSGIPEYRRLRALAEGIATLADRPELGSRPLVVMVDADIAASLGGILRDELAPRTAIVCLDNLELRPFDHVDVGQLLWPAGVYPVVIKSLLFGAAGGDTGNGIAASQQGLGNRA